MKNIKIGLLTAVALFTVFGCQKSMYYDEDNATSDGDAKKPVIFSGSVLTRMVDNTWETDDKIGVYMFQTGEVLSKESILSNSSNRKYTYSESKNGFTPQTKNDTLFYPQTGDVDFIAYYPYKSIKNYGVTVDVSNQAQPAAIDLLYSNNLKKVGKSDDVLTLNFYHQLSKLIFSISAGEGFSKEDLAGLKLTVEDVATRASFALPTGALALNDSSNKSVTAKVNEAGTQAEVIMLPQNCAKKQVKVTMKSLRSFVFEIISTEEWLSTHKYTYNIVLAKDNYSVGELVGTVEDWTDGGFSDLEQSGSSGLDASIWNGTSANTDWYVPNAISFNISTAEEFAGLSELVRGGVNFEGKTVHLLTNIDLDNHPWIPIGCMKEESFKGIFDGANHTISGLSPLLVEGSQAVGLFGDNSGAIKDIIIDGTILYEGSAAICGVSSLVGINRGTIMGCRNYASVSCTLLKTSEAKSILYLGGVTGANFGTITGCQNEGRVTGDNQNVGKPSRTYVGGLAGITSSVISGSENNQNISCKGDSVYAGGVVGSMTYSGNGQSVIYAKVLSCYNYGNVTVESSSSVAISGGIAGYMSASGNEVSGSYNYGEVMSTIINNTEYAKAGGITGENEGGKLHTNVNGGSVSAVNTLNVSCAAAGGIVGNNLKGGEVHTCVNESTAFIQAGGLTGGIAGVNNRAEGTLANVYDCCTNEGIPSKWIGNAAGSSVKSGVTTISHSDE